MAVLARRPACGTWSVPAHDDAPPFWGWSAWAFCLSADLKYRLTVFLSMASTRLA
jgi:hypothetical protein